MKLKTWLILSALVVGASAQAAEGPAAKTGETAKVSVLQKAQESAKKAAGEAAENAAKSGQETAQKAMKATRDAADKALEATDPSCYRLTPVIAGFAD